MDKSFGTLKKVELREYWKDEAKDFTPWLSKHLDLLGQAVQMELELVGTEQAVGDFKVDIVAKDSLDSDQHVVIENQLEKTNHDHLGKLLTYGAGHSAKAVIWVAKKLKEEHRKALDWLNEKTGEDIGFFGLEIELWQIGDSKPAPKFNLVSQPNDWAKGIVQQDRKLGEIQILQQEFWREFTEYINKQKSFLKFRKPRPQNWLVFSIGKAGFDGSLRFSKSKKQVSCEFNILDDMDTFENLKADKGLIEKELNTKLNWKELPNRKLTRIAQYKTVDFQDKKNKEELFKWFNKRAEAFYNTFHKRINHLDLIEEVA